MNPYERNKSLGSYNGRVNNLKLELVVLYLGS